MKTYLVVWFNSDGAAPSEVNSRLLSLGFKTVKGNYDFVYNWGSKKVSVEAILNLSDKVHLTLKGLNTMFKLETVDNKS